MNETQDTITEWGIQTFGLGTVLGTMLRLSLELNEAMTAVHYEAHPGHISDELADVDIILDQVFGQLGITAEGRQENKNRKMAVNRARKWGRTESGRAQHIEEDA